MYAIRSYYGFDRVGYIRVGSYTRKLTEFPEKESKIWNKKAQKSFESELAKRNVTADEIIRLLDTQALFDLIKLPYPTNRQGVIEKLESEKFIKSTSGKFHITNLGAILFAVITSYSIHYTKLYERKLFSPATCLCCLRCRFFGLANDLRCKQ